MMSNEVKQHSNIVAIPDASKPGEVVYIPLSSIEWVSCGESTYKVYFKLTRAPMYVTKECVKSLLHLLCNDFVPNSWYSIKEHNLRFGLTL